MDHEPTEGVDLLDELIDLVPPHLHHESGEVFYSGRTAFKQPSPIYLLGFNPGGQPDALGDYTIGFDLEESRGPARRDWSGYSDESWGVFGPGAALFQRRVLHMLNVCRLSPRSVPASNVIFVRSSSVENLDPARRDTLLRECWPVHEKVIAALDIRVVVCLGQDAGWWVRQQLDASTEIDNFSEGYEKRAWRSTTHQGRDGIQVVTLSHPSYAAWTNPIADPSELVVRAIARDNIGASSEDPPETPFEIVDVPGDGPPEYDQPIEVTGHQGLPTVPPAEVQHARFGERLIGGAGSIQMVDPA